MNYVISKICVNEVSFKYFLMFIFERERERQSTIREGAEIEGDKEFEAGSRL